MKYEKPEILEIGEAKELVLSSFGIKYECNCGGTEPNVVLEDESNEAES